MTKVVLLEFIDEFEAFQKFIQKKNLKLEDFLIVALEPKLASHLKMRNVLYENTLPYFNNDSHRIIIVESEKIMEHVRQNFTFVDDNKLSKCYQRECAHYIRVFMNHILKLLEIMHNISNQHGDIELYAFVYRQVSEEPLIGRNERYCGLLAERFAKQNNLKFFNINKGSVRDIDTKKRTYRFYAMEKLFFRAIVWLLKNNKCIMAPWEGGAFGKLMSDILEREKDIIFLGIVCNDNLAKVTFSNVISLAKLCLFRRKSRRLGVNVNFFDSFAQHEQKGALLQAIDMLLGNQQAHLFIHREIDYHDLVQRKASVGLKPHMVGMLSCSYALRYIFRRWKNIMIISHIGIGNMAVAGELTKVFGGRSLFISHGTHPVPIDSYHELELNNICRSFMLCDYTHIALSTPVQERHLHYFKSKYKDVDSNEVKTGPLIFASTSINDKALYKKNLGIPQDVTVIAYAVSTKIREGERFYFIETLDEFLSTLSDVVNAINAMDDIKLIIRAHPGFCLREEEIKRLLPASDKYIIHSKGLFSQVLGATDLLLSYSSTTIDEALINQIPVVLYDKWNRYNHFKTGVFENEQSYDIFPVCYVNSPDNLLPALKFMFEKQKTTKRENIDVDRYRYNDDYRENFYNFIKNLK